MNIFPPYFRKISPQIALINWDNYISKIKNHSFNNFDKILIKYSLNESGKYDCWFLQFYKGEFIRRFETLDSNLLDEFEFPLINF
jgi:hypothetical protein